MTDPVLEGFLREQHAAGLALAQQSDLLDLASMGLDQYVAKFRCKGLVRNRNGEVTEASEFHVGIWFPSYYLRRVEPLEIVTWLYPPNIWHPNIKFPLACVGRISAGTELVDLLYQVFEIITYHNWASHDGLNEAACQWARNHQDLFPLDRRPLKRRNLDLRVKESQARTA